MSIRTTRSEVLEATEHLPHEAILVVHGFEWDEYERLLDDLRDSRQLRVSYDSGRLRIMSISPEHEEYATAIEGLILAFCDEACITAEARGCATWRRETLARGIEADACYYVQKSHRIIGKRQIDLADDPPPDLVVEIDLSTEARHKFPIYGALGVSEVWQYDGEILQFYRLRNDDYVSVAASEVLPALSIDLLVEAMHVSKTEGQTTARKHLRRKMRSR